LLEQRGLVETTEHSASGRSLTVAVTAQGTSALADAEVAWSKAQAALVDVLGDRAPAELDGWLDHLDG